MNVDELAALAPAAAAARLIAFLGPAVESGNVDDAQLGLYLAVEVTNRFGLSLDTRTVPRFLVPVLESLLKATAAVTSPLATQVGAWVDLVQQRMTLALSRDATGVGQFEPLGSEAVDRLSATVRGGPLRVGMPLTVTAATLQSMLEMYEKTVRRYLSEVAYDLRKALVMRAAALPSMPDVMDRNTHALALCQALSRLTSLASSHTSGPAEFPAGTIEDASAAAGHELVAQCVQHPQMWRDLPPTVALTFLDLRWKQLAAPLLRGTADEFDLPSLRLGVHSEAAGLAERIAPTLKLFEALRAGTRGSGAIPAAVCMQLQDERSGLSMLLRALDAHAVTRPSLLDARNRMTVVRDQIRDLGHGPGGPPQGVGL